MDKETDAKKTPTRGLEDLSDLKLYTLLDLVPVLGLTRVSLLRHIQSGDLPARKIAGKWRFTRGDIAAFINGMAATDGAAKNTTDAEIASAEPVKEFDPTAYLQAIQEKQAARQRLRGEKPAKTSKEKGVNAIIRPRPAKTSKKKTEGKNADDS